MKSNYECVSLVISILIQLKKVALKYVCSNNCGKGWSYDCNWSTLETKVLSVRPGLDPALVPFFREICSTEGKYFGIDLWSWKIGEVTWKIGKWVVKGPWTKLLALFLS